MHTKKHQETCDRGEQNSKILQQRLGVFHHSNRKICFGFFFSRSVIVHHNEIAVACFSYFCVCFYPCHCFSCGHSFFLCKKIQGRSVTIALELTIPKYNFLMWSFVVSVPFLRHDPRLMDSQPEVFLAVVENIYLKSRGKAVA